MRFQKLIPVLLLACCALLSLPASSAAQIQPPTGPVVFCGTQATPNPDTYTVSVDGGAAAPLTMDATLNAACPAGSTHSFQLPAASFPIGSHVVRVTATNAFGATAGNAFAVVVGIAPGQFTITALVPPGL